jgi:acyl-CoA synthetase (NDP forming)
MKTIPNDLTALFHARSIAIVGASKNPRKASHQVIRSMLGEGYTGTLYPVNPNETEILGLSCYASVLDIPAPLELVIISLPAEAVLAAIQQAAGRKDICGAVILSAGFAETAIPEQVNLEREIVDTARCAGIRVIGPNCVGLICTDNKLCTGFIPGLKMKKGGLGFITQSGALGGSFLMLAGDQPETFGFNKFAHVGNMSDVTNLEILQYFGEDPEVEAIAMYLEGVQDGRELMRLIKDVSRRKPVFVLKVGRTEIGSRATLSHTGTLAGSDQVYSAALKQAGAVRVETLEELLDASKAATMLPRPQGRRVGVLTEAGGPGIIAMDEIGRSSALQMALFSEATRQKLENCLPPMAMICKPDGYVDMTAAAMEKEHAEALELILSDPGVDSAILVSLPPTFLPAIDVARAVADVIHRHQKPVVVCFMRGEAMLEARRYLERYGIPTFDSPEKAVRALIDLNRATTRLEIENRAMNPVEFADE